MRRSPIGLALDLATKRYEKATLDYQKFQSKIAELELEMPRLEQMKIVLENYLQRGSLGPLPDLSALQEQMIIPPAGEVRPAGPLPKDPLALLPEKFWHMIKDHPSVARGSKAQGAVVAANVDDGGDDRFLGDPLGQELLGDLPHTGE